MKTTWLPQAARTGATFDQTGRLLSKTDRSLQDLSVKQVTIHSSELCTRMHCTHASKTNVLDVVSCNVANAIKFNKGGRCTDPQDALRGIIADTYGMVSRKSLSCCINGISAMVLIV